MSEESLQDLVAGVIGGCCGIVVGQPFDTVKVRLQTHSSAYRGAFHCVSHTFKNEGSRGFFKGLASPLFGNIWVNAIVFGTYGHVLRVIEGADSKQPSYWSIYCAGSIAGFCQSIAMCPTDLIKCKLQVQDGYVKAQYNGTVDCAKQVYKANGLRGLFKGWGATIWRETPAFGVYFSLYEAVKRKMNPEPTNPSMKSMFVAGGTAGVVSWALCYPVDVIKSSIQTTADDAPLKERTMKYQAKKLFKSNGIKAFTNGLGTTLIRAFPVNAVTLAFYEYTLRVLRNEDEFSL